MSKRKKTKEQKIISDLNKRLQSQQAPSSRHLPTHSSTYSYKASTVLTSTKSPLVATISLEHVRHDLVKTSLITIGIIAFQVVLFYLLTTHMITIPMVRY